MSAQMALPEQSAQRRRESYASYILGPALAVALVREGRGTVGAVMASPSAAAAELLERVPDDGRERFGCVFLNVRSHPTAFYVVSVGSLTASNAHPREVFGPAIVACAASIILWHTHPSGDPEPSAEDLALTRRLVAAGNLLGITVVDHLILGQGTRRWESLSERGAL
jgi:DNA repair protein RadC